MVIDHLLLTHARLHCTICVLGFSFKFSVFGHKIKDIYLISFRGFTNSPWDVPQNTIEIFIKLVYVWV